MVHHGALRREEIMNTLYDFVTHVKGIEYLLSVTFIAGYVLFWETLKAKPFQSLVRAEQEDLEYIRETGGYRNVLKTAGRVAAAPFVGIAYVVALPFAFAYALAAAAGNGLVTLVGKEATFGWSPVAAYLTGRRKRRGKAKKH